MYYLIIDGNQETCFADKENACSCFNAAVYILPHSDIILAHDKGDGMKWDIELSYNHKTKLCISTGKIKPTPCIRRVHKLVENLKNAILFNEEDYYAYIQEN